MKVILTTIAGDRNEMPASAFATPPQEEIQLPCMTFQGMTLRVFDLLSIGAEEINYVERVSNARH